MGRLDRIETLAISGAATHNNLRLIMRGSPWFVDPQLLNGVTRFSYIRGSQFSALFPSNQSPLAKNATVGDTEVVLTNHPPWMSVNTLVRIGSNEQIGELAVVKDVQYDTTIVLYTPLISDYVVDETQTGNIPVATLMGTPCTIYEVPTVSFPASYELGSLRLEVSDLLVINPRIGNKISGDGIQLGTTIVGVETSGSLKFVLISKETTTASSAPTSIITLEDNKYLVLESWWPIVQSDVLLMSRTPAVFTSLVEYPVAQVVSAGTRTGDPIAGEPETVYRFVISLATKTGLLPFVPALGDTLFLRAQPLYYTRDFGVGDVTIPENQGPFLFDAYFGSMISEYKIDTKLGIKLWDGFGTQIGDGWTEIEPNHIILERPILSESLLFWQRIEGNFQYQKDRFFQAELSERGRFTMSSDLLVPKWPTDKQRGWVIPVKSPVAVRMIIQFEPQPAMVVEIPADTLTYVRPVILAGDVPIDRILVSFSGDAGTRVEIQDWRYDGEIPRSFSYYILGTGECYGNGRWLAGGFSIKPIFYSLSSLKARYSDTVSRYNAGYLYR